MASVRTSVYMDDYLEYSSTLAGDLQRILSTIGELDDRAHGIMDQTKEQIKYVLGVSSHGHDRPNTNDDDLSMEKMKKDIEANKDNALSLCTEKVSLARQAYDLDKDAVANGKHEVQKHALSKEGTLAGEAANTSKPAAENGVSNGN